jgi:hypothetical protein
MLNHPQKLLKVNQNGKWSKSWDNDNMGESRNYSITFGGKDTLLPTIHGNPLAIYMPQDESKSSIKRTNKGIKGQP